MNVKIKTLEDMYQSEGYGSFAGDTLYNPQYHMINDTGVDVDNMIECNEMGMFGISHQNTIDNWREYLDIIADDLDEKTVDNISKEIDDCEEWHIKNGSIDEII